MNQKFAQLRSLVNIRPSGLSSLHTLTLLSCCLMLACGDDASAGAGGAGGASQEGAGGSGTVGGGGDGGGAPEAGGGGAGGAGGEGEGGEGGGTTTGIEAFELVSSTPGDLSAQVSRDTRVSAEFSANVDCATVTQDTFYVSGPLGVVPAPIDSRVGDTVVLAPNDLDPEALYTVTIEANVASTSGVTLGLATSWSFTVAPRSWRVPVQIAATAPDIATGSGANLPVQLEVDSAGRAIVAWQATDSDRVALFATVFDPATMTWLPTEIVVDGASGDSAHASVAMDDAGRAFVAWRQSGELRVRSWDWVSGLGTTTALPNIGEHFAFGDQGFGYRVSSASEGRATLVSAQYPNSNPGTGNYWAHVTAQHINSGETNWQPFATHQFEGGFGGGPEVAAPVRAPFTATSGDGSTCALAQADVCGFSGGCYRPQLACFDGATGSVSHRLFIDGEFFHGPYKFGLAGQPGANGGAIHMLWTIDDGMFAASYRAPGPGISEKQFVAGGPPPLYGDPVIPMSVALDGEVLACWNAGPQAYCAVRDPNTNTWTSNIPINGATNIEGHLRLAHHPASKKAIALWMEAGIVMSNGYTPVTGWGFATSFPPVGAMRGAADGVPALRFYGGGDGVAVWKSAAGLFASHYR